MKVLSLTIVLTIMTVIGHSQTAIFSSGMTISAYQSVSVPGPGEDLDKAIDGNTSTKFLDFNEWDGLGFTVDLGNITRAANTIEITTANDASGRDPESYEVYGSVDGTTFILVGSGSIPCIGTRNFTRSFTFTNDLAFQYYRVNFPTRCGGDSEMQVAEVQLYANNITCPSPYNLSVTSASTTADLDWTEASSATNWDIELGVSGFTPTGNPTQSGIASHPYTYNGLTASTSYDYYVRAHCGGSDYSAWVGPFNFSTSCGTITAFPYCESFDGATESCWTVNNANGDGDEWDMNYSSNARTGSEVAQIYTDYNSGANDDWLITPPIALTNNQELSYWHRVYSSGEPNNFEVLLSTTGNSPANFTTTLLPDANYSNTTYQEEVINLSTYSGTVYIAFHVPSGGLDGWRLFIDDVCITDIPTCPQPTTQTVTNSTASSADLGWTENGSATTWDIELGPTGFTPSGTPTASGVTSNPYTYTGLTSSTSYSYYVRANCGGGDLSTWEGPFSFTTAYGGATPGGVSTDITLWLKAGSGITLSGGNVSQWDNAIPNTTLPNVTQSSSSAQPPITANALNFSNTVINFDGSNHYLDNIDFATFGDVISTTDNSLFLLQKVNSGYVTFQIEDGSPARRIGFENNSGVPRFDFPNDGVGKNSGSTSFLGTYHINTATTNTNDNTQYMDGAFESQITHSSSLPSTSAYDCVVGKQASGGLKANFDLVEIILFKRELSTSDRSKVETYLAIKAGITLGGNGASTNSYLAPTGTTIWDANTGYHNDVTSIAKDVTTQGLDQPKSTSLNTGSTLSFVIAHNSISSPTSLSADDVFVLVGHDNGDITNNSLVSYTHATTDIEVELNRVWRIQTTNLPTGKSTNELEIEFDMSNVPGNIPGSGLGSANVPGDLRLLLDDNTVFGESTVNERAYTHFAVNGNTITFKIPFSDLPANGNYFFTIGSINSVNAPLPIEVISFEAECNSSAASLTWTTASEINNDYFSIERSGTGFTFDEIGRVNGAGNSNSISNYSWTDYTPLDETGYYRLKQVDLDGDYTYSEVKTAQCTLLSSLEVYPNPLVNEVTLNSSSDSPMKYQIISIEGKVILEGSFNSNTVLDVSALSSGTYLLRATSDMEVYLEKLIKR